MKFVLAFICLVASVASMKDKHYLVETADKNGRSEKYQDGTDYSEGYGGYGSSKSSEEEKYRSGKYGHGGSREEVEYHWGEWSDWHNSVTCGSGTRSRNRKCIGSDDSHGTSSQCGGGDSHEVEDKEFKPCKYKKKRM